MILSTSRKDKLFSTLNYAVNKVYAQDYYLVKKKVHERTIVSRFCIYFQKVLNLNGYTNFNLDAEYNKDHSSPKRTENFPNGTYPDVIIHKRGSNKNNLCIIEFKTWWNDDTDDDIIKLKDFTCQSRKYKYGIGFSITLLRDNAYIQTVINGHISENPQLREIEE